MSLLRSSNPAAVTLALLLTGCGASGTAEKKPDAAPIVVTTAVAATQAMPDTIALTGELVASEEAHVSADTNGVVTSIRVERGQHVNKGDVVATVDARTAQLSADAAAAQRSLAEVQLLSAQDECTRAEALHQQGAMPQAQYDRALSQCQAQTRALQAAQANASLAGTSLSKAQIRAPFSGTVGEKLVDVGEFIAAAQPVITLYTDDALRVRFSVPERQSAAVVEGQVARFAVTAAPEDWREAIVRHVSPALRAPARDLVVEAEVADTTGLRPGMYAQIGLAVAQTPRVTVPDAAITTEGTVSKVYVVRSDRAFATIVKRGATLGGSTAVLTDLAAGDVVVLNAPEALHDGSRVTPTATGAGN